MKTRQRDSSVSHEEARATVKKAEDVVGVKLRDLMRQAATFIQVRSAD